MGMAVRWEPYGVEVQAEVIAAQTMRPDRTNSDSSKAAGNEDPRSPYPVK